MPASLIKHRLAKSWHKIIIQVDSRMTDAVAAYLTDLTGTGLEITSPENDQAKTCSPFPSERIIAYIPIDPKESDKIAAAEKIAGLKMFLSKLCHIFPDLPDANIHTETLIEEDWGQIWKSFFTSFNVTPTLTIKPSWEIADELKSSTGANKAVIELDPGLAFGTGHHASTQLALLLLEELFQSSTKQFNKVLDVGTGSGILAMACGLFGAMEVLAVDNDPDAIETSKQNILRNGLERKIKVSAQDVTSLKAGFDLVVANITHDVLAELAKPLVRLMHPNGFLVVSGILQGDQEHSILEMYEKQGLRYIQKLTKDEWVALQFQKKSLKN
jgi:ribosomal protein L11 methyltransferase